MTSHQLNPNLILTEAERNLEELENLFPVSAFPEPVQQIIKATNQYLQFPADFIGGSMLFAASVSIGNSYKVQIKNSWTENALIYLALIGRAGTMKSPPLKFALQPISDRDQEKFRAYKKADKDYKQALRQGEEPGEKPIFKKSLVSDFTPEALSEIHFYNLRGLGVYSDEIAGWIKNFNRYNQGNATEFWLQIFSGTPINIDRKSQQPILIPEPFVSVCGGMQPGILHELQKDNRGQNGFIDRLLFAMPEQLKKNVWNDSELPQEYINRWENIVNNLLDLPCNYNTDGDIQPIIIEFSQFAFDELKLWQAKNTELINNTSNDSLAGVYSKLEIYVIRFALILELLQRATEPPTNEKPVIGLQSVEGAIKLVEYFRSTAKRVNSILSNSPVEGLDTRKKEFYQKLPINFTTDQAVTIAYNNDFPERTLKRFLNDFTFFEKLERGKYKKRH